MIHQCTHQIQSAIKNYLWCWWWKIISFASINVHNIVKQFKLKIHVSYFSVSALPERRITNLLSLTYSHFIRLRSHQKVLYNYLRASVCLARYKFTQGLIIASFFFSANKNYVLKRRWPIHCSLIKMHKNSFWILLLSSWKKKWYII